MDISALYTLFLSCSEVTTDSRNCPPHSMFVALKGDSFNGNLFATQALNSGCSYVIIDEPQHAIKGDERYIVVEDSLTTLQQLANYHRRQLKTKVLGITGTNGKTTTKELIAAVLSKDFNILYTLGNLNNHIGVPLTLLRLKQEHEIAVIEMGANHLGEIDFLCRIAEPDFGIITNVGKAHLEGFGSFEGVIKTKGELYEFLRKRMNPVVFIHHENSYLMEIAKELRLIEYGTEENLYINGTITGNSPYLTFNWKHGKEGSLHTINTQLIGEYNFSNALAAVTIGFFFGVEPTRIDKALSEYTPTNNRSQLQKTADNTLIIDAYNANPTSMMAALSNFKNINADRKMLILGDMRELGEDSAAEHQRIVDYLQENGFENVVFVGDLLAAAKHNYPSYRNVDELIKALQENRPKGMMILIKGSNGIRLREVVGYL
ncbi:UDP-N-acetylmuramoyl-tripeptide--D-alanyl-D-alanine ligase [Bacteroides sp. 224]|uniref:UDP-N-acetylmuramoyl-tripeptide--D-alanyl-D- alanine ligase n=1 Tax=Bacteroides sp. 224 TaxID=2302936 RepID=UPI0013D3D0F3|nr:UDP-N-acetylmuramoyl-tripeptide--D-alanyl-D-alanine ligase [Bacteroides sp. 224]NDV66293.1 UDP-N-acetylmuramoyl-tripeptide--D-alanyl-D-alanine ligase [Bacteroides sp. 224]